MQGLTRQGARALEAERNQWKELSGAVDLILEGT